MSQYAGSARAGIGTSPLPQFSDGKPSVQVEVIPGVVKRGRLQTDFLCTVRDSVAVDVGVEIFGPTGTLLNDVHAGVGALLNVSPGHTVTFGTSGTLAYLESVVIPITGVAQGSARVVASSALVSCNVMIVDNGVNPPVSLATLGAGVRPAPGGLLATAPLPQFADGQVATHAAVIPGVIKKNPLDTDIFCTSLAAQPIDLGVELLGPDGVIRNSVAAGNGAVLNVAPGATVTFGTTGTLAFLENSVITTTGVAQGLARIVSTSAEVACTAVVLDSTVTPPAAMSNLAGFTEPGTQPPAPTATGPTATPTSTPTATATATPTSTATPTPVLSCASGSFISKPMLRIGKNLNPAGDETLRVMGEWQVVTQVPAIDPTADGFSFEVQDQNGATLFQRVVPGGAPTTRLGPGWTRNPRVPRWTFSDRNGTLAAGITRVVVSGSSSSARIPNLFKFMVLGTMSNFQVTPDRLPVQLLVILGGANQIAAGQCASVAFGAAGAPRPACGLSLTGNVLTCR